MTATTSGTCVLLHGAHTMILSLDSPALGGLCGCAMSERDGDDDDDPRARSRVLSGPVARPPEAEV